MVGGAANANMNGRASDANVNGGRPGANMNGGRPDANMNGGRPDANMDGDPVNVDIDPVHGYNHEGAVIINIDPVNANINEGGGEDHEGNVEIAPPIPTRSNGPPGWLSREIKLRTPTPKMFPKEEEPMEIPKWHERPIIVRDPNALRSPALIQKKSSEPTATCSQDGSIALSQPPPVNAKQTRPDIPPHPPPATEVPPKTNTNNLPNQVVKQAPQSRIQNNASNVQLIPPPRREVGDPQDQVEAPPHDPDHLAAADSPNLHVAAPPTNPATLKKKPYECVQCDQKCFSQNVLFKHRKATHEKDQLKCPSCGKQGFSQRTLIIHQKSHTDHTRPYKCEYPRCDKRFVKDEELKNHVAGWHGDDKPLKCPEAGCIATFLTTKGLEGHLRNKHGKSIKDNKRLDHQHRDEEEKRGKEKKKSRFR